MKKHCVGYFLDLKYRKWKKVNDIRREKYENLFAQKKEIEKELADLKFHYNKIQKTLEQTQREYDDYIKSTKSTLHEMKIRLNDAHTNQDDLISLKRKIQMNPPDFYSLESGNMIEWTLGQINMTKMKLDQIDHYLDEYNEILNTSRNRKEIKKAKSDIEMAVRDRRAYEFLRKRLNEFFSLVHVSPN